MGFWGNELILNKLYLSFVLPVFLSPAGMHEGVRLRLLGLHLLVGGLLLLLLLLLLMLAQRRQCKYIHLAPLLPKSHGLGTFFEQENSFTLGPYILSLRYLDLLD